MSRKMIDCRDHPSDKPCSITIAGEEEEVVRAATEHAISVHGEQDTPELRAMIRQSLKDEPEPDEYSPERLKTPAESGQANSFTG